MASTPRLCSAMAIRLTVCTSPVESKASISRLEGAGFTFLAKAIKPLVVLPMAEHTTTKFVPWRRSSAARRAMAIIFSVVATLLPPYLCTNLIAAFSFFEQNDNKKAGRACALTGKNPPKGLPAVR